MERLFSPCTRYRVIRANQSGLRPPEWLRELNLDISTEELLSPERAFTYVDLYAMLENGETAAQLTPHASVVGTNGKALLCSYHRQSSFRFSFSADGKKIVALARSPEHLLEICDVVLRLLAASVVHSVTVHSWSSRHTFYINSASLTSLMQHCQSLNTLTFEEISFKVEHCLVLGDFSRPGLEIVLIRCTPTTAGTRALAEVLGRDQCPTKLHCCHIDYNVLANGLRGNSRLKSLIPSIYEDGHRQVLAIADALRENKGLIELVLQYNGHIVSDETWGAVCDSLKKHPKLEVLQLWGSAQYEMAPLAPEVRESRIQAVLDMMKVNLSIHTIRLDSQYTEHELLRGSVIPILETNRFRPRLLAIQTTRPMAYRAKVLGRALLAVRTDPHRFWMLLSGNAEVAFLSTTANFPTPANAAATSTTYVAAAAVAASVMPALTATATGSLPTATSCSCRYKHYHSVYCFCLGFCCCLLLLLLLLLLLTRSATHVPNPTSEGSIQSQCDGRWVLGETDM
jgi:hypothetical protein